MDPLSLFSLSCGIITAVDAAVKTVGALKDLYQSSSGFSNVNLRLQAEAEHLEAVAKNLSDSEVNLSTIRQSPLVGSIARECIAACEQIQIILAKCQVKPQEHRVIATIKSWSKSRTLSSEIEGIHANLVSCSSRLKTAVAAATR